jgi:hypothetical protein
MMVLHSIRVIAAALCLSAASQAWAGQKAEKIAVTPDSDRAVIIIKSQSIPPPPTMASGFHLTLAAYDAQEEALASGLLGGSYRLLAKPKLFYDGYLVADIKPGTYIIQEFTRQDRWALCYNGESRVFTVKAGEALYLGEFDSIGSLRALDTEVGRTMRFISVGGKLVHFFDVAPPQFKPVGEGEVEKVQAFVAARMPRTTAPVKAVEFAAGRFGTGSDLFGTNRVCGGYYKGSAKPKPEP